MGLGDNDFNNNVNANGNFNNNSRARGIAICLWKTRARDILPMKTYKHLFERLVSVENLEQAYWQARKRKSGTRAVQDFDKHWRFKIVTLHRELRTKTYTPRHLKTFILRDPKTRTISVSDFRDRIVHHALINVLNPIYEPRFIYDSYASRKGKGTLHALKRFDYFVRKTTRNGKSGGGGREYRSLLCSQGRHPEIF